MARFIPVDEVEFARKSKARALKSPYAVAARFDARRKRLIVELNTGVEFSFEPSRAFGLEHASDDDLRDVVVDGAGSTLSLPRLDADFSVARLLEGFLGPLDWVRREARAAASRQNGKLGGRPRKNSVAVAT
jgi:hypothetical protein